MDIETIKTIYGVTALAGIVIYALLAWKASKPTEAFSPAKFFTSILTSGTLGLIISAAGLASLGFNFITLFTAFFMGVGIDVSLNKFLKVANNQVAKVSSPALPTLTPSTEPLQNIPPNSI